MDLDWVATELNDQHRNRIGYASRSRRSDHYCCDDRLNPPFPAEDEVGCLSDSECLGQRATTRLGSS